MAGRGSFSAGHPAVSAPAIVVAAARTLEAVGRPGPAVLIAVWLCLLTSCSAPRAASPPVVLTVSGAASVGTSDATSSAAAATARTTNTMAATTSSATTSTSPRSAAETAPQPAGSSLPPTAPVGLPDVGLAGVNDPACTSTKPPVVLLHGSFSTVADNFAPLVAALLASGRCAYGLDYGNDGTAAVTASATQAADLVRLVLTVTGAAQVDVVGYSQGGLVLRTALRLNGLARVVRVAVLLAPSFHGTTSPLATLVPGMLCPACADQAAGSPLLTRLDAGGDLDGDVRYAVLSTRDDQIVTPVSSQIPDGPADRVRSLEVQQACPGACLLDLQ